MSAETLMNDNLMLALEHGEVCLWQLDYAGKLIAIWNDTSQMSMFAHDGISFSMVMDEFLGAYCAPDEIGQIIKRLEYAFESETPFQMEHQLYNRKTHTWIWVHSFGVTRAMPSGTKRFYGVMHNIDARKRYERTLGKQEQALERVKIMLDAMPLCCTFWANGDEEPIDCNLEAMRLFGVASKQEYLDRFYNLSPEFQPDGTNSRESIKQGIKEIKSLGYSQFEWMHQSTAGEPIPTEITLISIKKGHKDIVIGYTRDLREAKRMLAMQEEAAKRTSVMLNALPIGCGFWDASLKRIDCNDEMLRMFKLASKEEYLHNFDHISPEYQPGGQKSAEYSRLLVQHAFDVGRVCVEWLHRDTQGNEIPSEMQLIRAELDGEPIVLSYTRDLRELKEAEKARHEADERTQVMLDAMPMCCILWDKDINTIDCNNEAVRLFGLSSKEEYLADFHRLSPKYQSNGELSDELFRKNIARAFETGYERFEWVHHKLDGEIIPSEVTLVRAKHRDGPIVVSYTRDLREVKAALEEIYKTQEELREARDLAERNAKTKSNFLANMSHEIRTPMNAILGMLHLLEQSPLNTVQHDYLTKAEHSAELLLRVINDILDFSKIEAGKIEMERIDFDLKRLPLGIRDIMGKRLREKGLNLDITIDPIVPQVLNGDPVRLEQIVLNLVSNAVKFTEEGGVSIHISRKYAPTGLVKLLFEIADTGIGMSEAQVSKLFTPFTQADTSTTRKYGGTGLGLAICQSLVDLMAGEIWCESEPGRGSTFYFTAVFELPKGEVLPSGVSTAVFDEAAKECLGNMKVLLAEDNEINQIIAVELLQAKGVEVDIANNGAEAVEAVNKKDYDVVLMDIQMPEMDGISATRLLRRNKRYAALPIIAMTAHAMAGDREHSLKNGLNDHITKPIDPDLLYATLLKWACPNPLLPAPEKNAGQSGQMPQSQ